MNQLNISQACVRILWVQGGPVDRERAVKTWMLLTNTFHLPQGRPGSPSDIERVVEYILFHTKAQTEAAQ